MQIDVKVTIYNILNFFMTCNIKKKPPPRHNSSSQPHITT